MTSALRDKYATNSIKFWSHHISEMLRKSMVWTIQSNVKKESLYLTLPPYKRSHNALRHTLGCKNSRFYIWDFVLTHMYGICHVWYIEIYIYTPPLPENRKVLETVGCTPGKPKFLLFIFAFVSLSPCPVLPTPFLFFLSLFQKGGVGIGGEVLPMKIPWEELN